MSRIALYTGSFDPLTLGHLHILLSAAALFDRLVVAVGVHPTKVALLSAARRAELIAAEAEGRAAALGCRLEVTSFSGLAIDAARRFGARTIVRGLRSTADFDDEMTMAGMNAALAPEVQTIFIPASIDTRHITATLVRQIAGMGGDLSAFVPAGVAAALRRGGPLQDGA
jgi:pantetheine-phosphate adenylyltransferase